MNLQSTSINAIGQSSLFSSSGALPFWTEAPYLSSSQLVQVISAAASKPTTTRLQAAINGHISSASENNRKSTTRRRFPTCMQTTLATWWKERLPPRARAAIYMSAAMSFHFGGYEFMRNSSLSLFTSTERGFQHASAFPLASALVSPFSVGLLFIYGRLLNQNGPRVTLRQSTLYSIAFVLCTAALLSMASIFPRPVRQAITGLAFLFQSSYSYSLNAQQWSFLDSILTPDQGARWFTVVVGVSSCVCTLTASLVPVLLPRTGLLGLYALTAFTLSATLLCGDRAYAIAQECGFDPMDQREKRQDQQTNPTSNDVAKKANRVTTAVALFRRVPTLGALFSEGIAFHSLSTILNVAFVQALKAAIPNDLARSAYTGRFYALCSAVAATLQFGVLPLVMNRLEPKQIWRFMPILPSLACLVLLVLSSSSVASTSSQQLLFLASAFFLTKTMDYSLRSVVYNMVYQPLDFESRFVGKEIISVFGSRLGKSGMSLILSALAALNLLPGMSSLALTASSTWMVCAWGLSSLLPSKAEAQRTVELRRAREQHPRPHQEPSEVKKES